LGKIKKFIPENASFQEYFTEVSFDTSEENQLSYFQNDFFFKFFGDFMRHIIGQNAGKKIKCFYQLFINEKIDNTFV
jgi:hypothetical protein